MMEMAEPRRLMPSTASELPRREKDRTDMVEPNATKSRTCRPEAPVEGAKRTQLARKRSVLDIHC